MRTFLLAMLIGLSASAADKSVSLQVSGWHSKGDAFKTEEAVRGVKGVKTVNCDLHAKKMTVSFDDAATSQEAIKKAVGEAGYQATAAE
jgi:mercuric ion binding protein